MSDTWALVRLGDVLHLRQSPVAPVAGQHYKQITLAINGRGARLRRVVDGSEAMASRQFMVRAGDLLVSKIDARNGAAAVVPESLDGSIVTSDFPTFEIDRQRVAPGFVDLYVRRPEFATLAETVSAGTTNRVRMDPRRFMTLMIGLPPLAEQRRIVDLIGTLQAVADAATAEVRALRVVAETLREEILADAENHISLDGLITGIEAGRSPDGLDRQPESGESSVLKLSAVRSGWFDRTQVKVIGDAKMFPGHAVVRDGDLLITRANTRDLVGMACIVVNPYPNSYLCDKTLRLVPNTAEASAEYLLEVLLSAGCRRQLSDAATGTSASMKNISQAAIRSIRVPLLPRRQQARLVLVASGVRDAAKAAETLAASVLKTRAATLSALLAGEVTIPASYDRFLDGAA